MGPGIRQSAWFAAANQNAAAMINAGWRWPTTWYPEPTGGTSTCTGMRPYGARRLSPRPSPNPSVPRTTCHTNAPAFQRINHCRSCLRSSCQFSMIPVSSPFHLAVVKGQYVNTRSIHHVTQSGGSDCPDAPSPSRRDIHVPIVVVVCRERMVRYTHAVCDFRIGDGACAS